MGKGDGGYSCGGEGVIFCDEDGPPGLLCTETCKAGFGLEGVTRDDLILGKSREIYASSPSASEGVGESSKGAKVLREDRGVPGEEVANMESGSGESERRDFSVGGEVGVTD